MSEFNFKEIEKKWRNKWTEDNLYKTSTDNNKKKMYVLDMFPFPSGEGLHVGHPKGYIATDIYSRMKKLQGYNVLHPMGFDTFGLPTEEYAIKNKIHPKIAADANIKRFKEQLDLIGFNYDWEREISTANPEFYKWTQWQLKQMFKKGLMYESNEPINWCPSCKTGLANEDLEDNKCERCGTQVEKKPIRQWVIKITDYAERLLKDLDKLNWPESIKESQRNWIGISEGSSIDFTIKNLGDEYKFTIFTTRADTLFGATYCVLAPEHKLIEKLLHDGAIKNKEEVEKYIEEAKNKTEIERGKEGKEKTGVRLEWINAINPANNEEIPIYIADYVLASYGAGAIMAVPAHDERDMEFANKFNIPIKQVIMPSNVDANNLPKAGKENTKRDIVHIILRSPQNNSVLVEFLNGEEWGENKPKTFIIGGIEEGEAVEEAAVREIKEETGYKNVNFVEEIPFEQQSLFYAAHKDVNRLVNVHTLVFDLIDEEREEVIEEEKKLHDIRWIKENEVEEDEPFGEDWTPKRRGYLRRLKSDEDITELDV